MAVAVRSLLSAFPTALPRARRELVASGGALAALLTAALLTAALGDSERAASRVVLALSAPDAAAATHAGDHGDSATVGLRSFGRDAAADHGVAIDLRPALDESVEPRLPGVGDPFNVRHAASGAAPASTTRGGGLPPSPIRGLTQDGPGGLLPAVGPDGLTPRDAYARPFANDKEWPVVSVVVGGLGLSRDVTTRAIAELPPEVTLSFVPYADNLQAWIDQARAAGHEVILEIPMEPYDYPDNDPGPHTLLAQAPADENLRRLDWLMARATGYFGVMNYLGARFTTNPDAAAPVLDAIGARGVALLYDGETRRTSLRDSAVRAGVAYTAADRVLDARPTAAAIDEQLLHLEAQALQNGAALGVSVAYPVTLDQLIAWAKSLDYKEYALAPASAALRIKAAQAAGDVRRAEAESIAAAPVFTSIQAGYGSKSEGDAKAEKSGGGH